jgi:hypothetical protein
MQPCREAFPSPPPHQVIRSHPQEPLPVPSFPCPSKSSQPTHCTKQAQWLIFHLNQKLPHVASGETVLSASNPRRDPDDPRQQQCHPRRRTKSRPGLLLLLAGPTTPPTALCTPGRPMDIRKRTSRTALRTALNNIRRPPKRSSLDALLCDSERTASQARSMHRLLRGNTSMLLPYTRRIAHPA